MIQLRPLEREDLKQLRDWRNDPEIFSRVREHRLLGMEDQEYWFNSLIRDSRNMMFGVMDEERFIGVCGLTHVDWVGRKAEVSIYIGDARFRGKGYGSMVLGLLADYAFGECNLNRLWAEVFESNEISARLFRKAGYASEGKMRKHAYKNKRFLDSEIFGLLREEWIEKVAP